MGEKRSVTDAEREQRRAQDRERLKAAAEQLLTSDGWQRWARVRAQGGLARLCLLIWGGLRRRRVSARQTC